MTCRETEDEFGAYRDGGLAPARTLEVEGHLRGCPACTAKLRGMRAASAPRARRWPLVLLAAAACVAAFWILGTR